MSDPLHEAFLATRYRVQLEGRWIDTRIGQPSPQLATWLAAQACAAASLISARNPQGRALEEAANLVREAQLLAQLADSGLQPLPAEGVADDGRWHEPSFWVPGLHGAQCRAVMQCFDQLAWVEYDAAGRARLRWTRDPIPEDTNPCR